jgi:hypothetical protein
MDVVASLEAPCPPAELYRWVEDLTTYPRWLEIVTRVEPLGDGVGDTTDGEAWAVDLRGRLGPLARSKRLRMVRTVHDGREVRFERAELDGRDHSPWILGGTVTEDGGGSRLEMRLHYGGGLFGPVLERVLRDEIDRSRDRLRALVTT